MKYLECLRSEKEIKQNEIEVLSIFMKKFLK